MVISPQDKAILLERLQKAREVKAAKVAAKKTAPAVAPEPAPPAPAPAPPAPAPPAAPAAPEEPTPAEVPKVPDLVAASKKPPKKKQCFIPSSSDTDSDEEEIALPKKIKAAHPPKKQAYMKIKLYKEPKNAAAFQQMIEAVQDESEEVPPYEEPAPPQLQPKNNVKFANANCSNAAMKKGAGVVSHQELMRRAALEFFS